MLEVLIDTWWNVNLTSTGYVRRDVRVLIDTWWNVNNETIEPNIFAILF